MSAAARKTHNGVTHHRSLAASRASGQRARRAAGRPMLRKRSKTQILGFPLWEVARGPDPSKGERVGHARAVFAMGDIADGIVAIGGISRGVISIGGLSFGLCSVGGISVGLAAAVGGVAVAPLALGGVALGLMALGGTGYDMDGRVQHAQSALGGFAAFIPSFLSGNQGQRGPHRHRDHNHRRRVRDAARRA